MVAGLRAGITLLCWVLLLRIGTCSVQFNPNNLMDIKPTTHRGLVIDAGSGGSRLHIFNWEPRIFSTLPPPITYPNTDEKWTARMSPGIATLAGSPALIAVHLAALIDFATSSLVGFEDEFADIPLFFKATGGVRELASPAREKLIQTVRNLLSDKSFSPFFFRYDLARVISGEEEAVFSWAAVNFLFGKLIQTAQPDSSSMQALNGTFGTIDLGGASAQVGHVPVRCQ